MRRLGICRSVIGFARVAGLAALLAVSGQALAQISITKHNLGTTGTAGNNRVTAGTDEICVFCHTPHASNTAMTSAPLWNKNVPATTYSVYDTTVSNTIDGRVLQPGAGTGSVSVACLSCHDGTQAMDNIINAPGSGGYDVTGGGPTGRTYTWDTTTGRVNTDGLLLNNGQFIANLSTDLKNDHPVGIQYCGGGVNVTNQTTATCRDGDFNALTTDLINGQRVWWVDSGTSANLRDKRDMILYTRDFGGTATDGIGPSVECASCHDPHSSNPTFLRIVNSGSAVCLACHNK